MRYTLLFYETPEAFASRTDPERQPAYLASWSHYVNALREAGVVLFGSGLYPPEAAASLRREGDGARVQDGPVTEAKEQLGGIFVIEVPDQDAALEWAARAPVDTVEVRPNLPPLP